MSNKADIIIVILLLIILLFNFPVFAEKNEFEKYSNGTVLAIYMIGSNLEYDPQLPNAGGAASRDISEIVSGYGNGAQGLDVLIAYGGSRKPGWQGISVATPEQLREDLSDGFIGGNCPVIARDKNANMADNKTLTWFLQYVGTSCPGKRILLVFWDHGMAWNGFGLDENHIDPATGKPTILSVSGIKGALHDSGFRYDLIGYDACLMANLEMVSAVAPYGEVFVASEDQEPDFGWDWVTVLQKLVEDPSIQPEDLGKVIVDAYLDNQTHTREGKTLSVIDLTKIDEVSKAFNEFSSNLGGKMSDPDLLQTYSEAVLKVKAFGTYILKGGETYESSVDLRDYLSSIKKSNPDLSNDIDPILSVLNEAILYSREDGSRPNAKGLSIYSPYMAILASQNKVDLPPRDLLTGFDVLLEKFIGELKKENIRILNIIEDKDGYTVIENASVFVELTYIQNTDKSMIVLSTEPAYPDKPGHYPFPKWGGWGLMWKDPVLEHTLVVPVNFIGSTLTGRERYKAYGKISRGDVTKTVQFDFYYEPTTGEVSYYITPYTITGKSTPVFDRTTWVMEPGDNLTMMAMNRFQGSGSERFDEYGSIIWTQGMNLGYGMLPCGYKYTIIFDVYDVTRKSVYQDYNDIAVPCQNGT